MKKRYLIVCALSLCLFVTACGSIPKSAEHIALEEETVLEGTVKQGQSKWDYAITTYTASGDYCAADGRVLSHHSYQVPRMKSKVSGKDAAAARQAAENFNRYFDEQLGQEIRWFEEMGEIARQDYELVGQRADSLWQEEQFAYLDTTELAFWCNGSLLCVTTTRLSDTGGPHPSQWRSGVLFDMAAGKVVTLADLVQDQEQVRLAVQQELVRQVQAMLAQEGQTPEYYDDYERTLGEWMERPLLPDDEGITVVFSVYDLASYDAGEQTFFLPYRMMQPYWNEWGQRLFCPAA